jgi:hypothetical protein
VFDSVSISPTAGAVTLRWALFFFALAILNEIVWRTQSTDVWQLPCVRVLPLTSCSVLPNIRCRRSTYAGGKEAPVPTMTAKPSEY